MKKTLFALAASLAVAVVAASPGAYAGTIDLGPANQGGYYSQADPGVMIFTGNGSGGFSSVYWNGWIGLASGPGAMSGAYSMQGNAFVAGAPVYGPGPLETWGLTDLGNSMCYDSSLNDLCSGEYLLAYLTFVSLSGSPSLYQISGTVWDPSWGSLAPYGQAGFYVLLNTGGVDLAGLANGATASATILGGAVVPEPGTFSLLGLALGLLGLASLKFRSIQA